VEYWVVDGERREIHVIRAGEQDVIVQRSWIWRGAPLEPLLLDVAALFE